MQVLTNMWIMTCACLLVTGVAHAGTTAGGEEAAAGAAETEAKTTVQVTLSFKDGRTLDGTLLEGTKDGSLKITSPYGEQTFARKDWVAVKPKTRPVQFGIAEQMLRAKKYSAAVGKYDEIYTTYEHLYVFGAEALAGKGQALFYLKKYKVALAVYDQLFAEYSGADLSYSRRYLYGICLGKVGGKANDEKAVTQLEAVVAATDDLITVRTLNQLGKLHYGNKDYYLALRSFMQVYILYRSYRGDGANEVQSIVASARKNAVTCCDKLMKTNMKKRAEKIKARLVRAK